MTFVPVTARRWRDPWPLVARTDDGNPWTTGTCWLYCRRQGVRVLWVGSVTTPGATGDMYACGPCVAELDHMVRADLAGDEHGDLRRRDGNMSQINQETPWGLRRLVPLRNGSPSPHRYKPLHAGAYEMEGEPAGIWAAPVGADEIDDAVCHSAHLFQARVPKTADVRVVVVGEQVFSARIVAPPGVLDWRAAYQDLTYEPVACPEDLRWRLRRYLAAFGLDFGAFDFAVTADDAWWFLECNPNGQWAWLEDAAGLPITHAIADLLENGASPHD